MLLRYILNAHGEPEACDDINTWSRWFQTADRRVAFDGLPDGVQISTVFLGLDHNFHWDGPPVLWETMIFGGPHDGYSDRYTSRADAVLGHHRAVMLARNPSEP